MAALRIKIDGDMYSIDLDDMEIGDAMDIEEVAGCGLGELGERVTHGHIRPAYGLAFAAMRQRDPDLTIRAFRKIKFSKVEFLGEEADPTAAAEESSVVDASATRVESRRNGSEDGGTQPLLATTESVPGK